MKKIGLVHATMNSVNPILQAFQTYQPSADLVNVMDESLIWELNKTNEITENMIRRLVDIAGKAEDAGVNAILFTCSSFSPYVPEIKKLFSVPVLSSDESMLKEAVNNGNEIGVIATVKKAGPTTTNLLYEEAEKNSKRINVQTSVIPEAFQSLQKGDRTGHDNIIHSEINKMKDEFDVVVLAQYSMSQSLNTYQEKSEVPILTAPKVAADSIVSLA